MKDKSESNCKACGNCCKKMKLPINGYDQLYWVECHIGKDCQIEWIKDMPFAVFPVKCKKLVDNKCSIYEGRPLLCRDFYCDRAQK